MGACRETSCTVARTATTEPLISTAATNAPALAASRGEITSTRGTVNVGAQRGVDGEVERCLDAVFASPAHDLTI